MNWKAISLNELKIVRLSLTFVFIFGRFLGEGEGLLERVYLHYPILLLLLLLLLFSFFSLG